MHLLKENKFDGVDLLHHWSQKDHKENKKKHLKEKKDFDWSNYAGNPAAPKQVFSQILEAPKEKPNPISKEPPKEPIKETEKLKDENYIPCPHCDKLIHKNYLDEHIDNIFPSI